jgi:hypothetical protein
MFKNLFNISILRLFGLTDPVPELNSSVRTAESGSGTGLFSATLCQRSLRISFEYTAFALLRLAKNHHKKIR